MYTKGYYKNKSDKDIEHEIHQEGFDPIKIANQSGFIYPKHHHPEKKLLAFLSGSMEVWVNGKIYRCEEGDKLFIEGNTEHSAVVGDDGCVFFWSEKL